MKTPEYDIVCVAQPAWEGPYAKSTVLLMKEMATYHRALYVDYASTWKDLIGLVIKGQFGKAFQMLGLKRRMTHYREGQPVVLTLPPMLPLNFLPEGRIYQLINRINGWTAGITIRKAMQKLRFQNAVVINAFAPGLGAALLGQLKECANVYYCYDEISQAEWNSKHGGLMEKIYAAKADATVFSSDALLREKHLLNHNSFVVKNGVDASVFLNTGNKISKDQRLIVGFVGSLDSRIDYLLLDELISRSPEFTFRFIGRVVDEKFNILRRFSNVEWVAPVSYQLLPAFIQVFDIGIIPFVKSEFTSKIYPLKINEYLAMGKPVVMTSFARLPEFDGVVSSIDLPVEFKNEIITLTSCDSILKMEERKSIAQKNSWEQKAIEFCSIIDSVLDEKA